MLVLVHSLDQIATAAEIETIGQMVMANVIKLTNVKSTFPSPL